MKPIAAMSAFVLALVAAAVWAGSGYTVNGTDLDSIFAPYHSGWPQAAATGYLSGGVDLNARYAPLSTGSAASATGFKVSGGADLSAIFAAAGTTGVQVASQPSSVSGSAAAGNPSGTVTSSSTSASGAKGSGSYSYTWHITSGSASPTAPNSQISAVTGNVSAGSTISGTWYATISDGVTSVNTNTVGWSLQNTTPAGYTGTLIAGSSSDGFHVGFAYSQFGSISPANDVHGNLIEGLADDLSNNAVVFELQGSFPQTYFSQLKINSNTYSTASGVSWTQNAGNTYWSWSGTFGFLSGDSYSVQIQ